MLSICPGGLARLLRVGLTLLFMFQTASASGLLENLNLTDLSLEELMNLEVITLTKREQRLFDTPAAVYVLTGEELRRSGARSIPDALRTVPGIHVAHVDANKWVVATRGFAGLFVNKLLVLIDGRTVYTPLFSGVFWETHDLVLEDVERIEIIRGPGGTLWGANAVNGILNIITKNAYETSGGYIRAGAGTEERAFSTLRYGVRTPRAAFRVYGKALRRDASADSAGNPRKDGWHLLHAGGRLDWRPTPTHSLSLHGNLYTGEVGQTFSHITSAAPPYLETVTSRAPIDGANILARWEYRTGPRSDLALQTYYDRSAREDTFLKGEIHTVDIDFQHRLQPGPRHELVWGAGYRFVTDHMEGSFTAGLVPPERRTHLLSGFLHYEIALRPRLRLSAGVKTEHNSFTGFEYQPNGRLWWSPAPEHALWVAFTRAVRTPSRAEHDFAGIPDALLPGELYTGSPAALLRLTGTPDFISENLLAFDAGYRLRLNSAFSFDLAGFFNRYRNLRTSEPDFQNLEIRTTPPLLIVPVRIGNKARAWTGGVELSADWQARAAWNIRAAYTHFRMDIDVSEDSRDTVTGTFDGENPEHQFSLRSCLDLPGGVQLDLTGRYVGGLPTQRIPAYFTLDARVGWRLRSGLDLTVATRNLVDAPRREFISMASGTLPTATQAGIYASLARKF